MDILDFIKKQREFDQNFITFSHWAEKISQENLDVLGFLLLAIQGEIGECCNIYKKLVRKDNDLYAVKDELIEEITDVFIYLLKLIDQLDIDIETEFLKKQAKNYEKFKRLGK